MCIKIGNYNFEGPFDSIYGLENKPGVYAILGWNPVDKVWEVVDIGRSRDVESRVRTHDREDCWEEQGYTTLSCAAFYCDAITRHVIEKELRDIFEPPCGER